MKIFDSHTHLNSDEFVGREEKLIAGVTKMNVAGVDRATSEWALRLTKEFPEQVVATIGWHPDEAGTYDEGWLFESAVCPEVVAIGEIGLDYHWNVELHELQEEVFRKQIRLAKRLGKPFQVHTRDALEDTYRILQDEGIGDAGAIIHNFSGTADWAQKFADLGMLISFSGVVTFKKALGEQEAAAKLPLSQILVETDAPYLTPVPFRGKENQPGYTIYVIEKIAELRGISAEEVADATYANAMRVFQL
ncbi:MAG: TatD family hydrolase [Streptococcaceae bacterium]|jgi:TatD DNase family protein|nr:TatD family hydrolase [Streptococcaceae bacterium]